MNQTTILGWGCAAAVVVSLLVTILVYFLERRFWRKQKPTQTPVASKDTPDAQ